MLLFATIVLVFISGEIKAQDYITLKSGEEIKSKVTEITSNEIKYKKFENLDGPIISIDKSTVFMIKYKNGTKDIINAINENAKNDNAKNDSKVESKSVVANVADEKVKSNKHIPPSKRNGFVAFGLSFLYPGIGQAYNRQPVKGLIMTLTYGTSIILFANIPVEYYYNEYDGYLYSYWPTGKTIGLIGAGAIWLWSVIDAPISSSIVNKKNGFTSNIFENNKIGVNLEPHTDFAFVNHQQYPTIGAKLTLKIK